MKNPLWLGVLVVSLLVGAVSGIMYLNRGEYTASAPGTLDDQYTEVRSRRGGKRYEVKYSFQVDGKSYRGGDTIYSEPQHPATTVWYEPANPSDNGLSKKKGSNAIFGVILAVIGVISAGKNMLGGGSS